MLTATFHHQYKKDGKPVFVYDISGPQAELDAYQESKGEFARTNEDTGNPVFFTRDFSGKSCPFKISGKGNYYLDTSEMDMMASMVERYGGNLGQAMANSFVAQMTGVKRPAQPQIENSAVEEESDEGLGDV